MTDKEEVEPTEESAAAESSHSADAIDAQSSATSSGSHALGADPVRDDAGVDSEDATDDQATGDESDERSLEPAGVGASAAGAGSIAERRAGRKPKEVASDRRDEPAKVERTGPVKFVRESVGELRKVVYPTGQQLINYFVVVLVFVLFIIGYVSLLDLGLGAAIFRIFS